MDSQPQVAAPADIKKVKMSLPAPLQAAEKAFLAARMANYQGELERLLSEKHETVSALNKSITAQREIVSKVALRIREGDNRIVECEVTLDTPNRGEKSIKRLDTGETWTTPMSADDYQQDLVPVERQIGMDNPPGHSWYSECNDCQKSLHRAVGKGYLHDDESPACGTEDEPKEEEDQPEQGA